MAIEITSLKPPVFLMNDQPAVCGKCDARCEELASFMHTNVRQALLLDEIFF